MAGPTYSTDLTTVNVVDTAGGTTNWTALGGGAAGLNSETDYFIQGDGCISKNGWTANTRGMIYNGGTVTITAGDAIFIWKKQNNRNLMDTVAAGGSQIVVGSGTGAYDHFYVDGSDAEGSALAGWRSYAVDPTQTPSTTTGTPTNTNYIGGLWKILGSGSLKGAPNGIDAFRHGREIRMVDGDGTSGYATFDGAAAWDANTTRAWGIITPTAGAYQMHGCFVMGTAATAVDFRDSGRNIVILEDPFVPSTFNEFEIRNASSNVEWDGISISHLGTTSPAKLTLDVGTFTGNSNRFVGCHETTFNPNGSSACTNSEWTGCERINLNEADISGSSVLTPSVAADGACVYDNRSASTATIVSELDGCTLTQGANAHHGITFGSSFTGSLTIEGIEFTGFDSTDDVDGSHIRLEKAGGTQTVTLINCTVDGAAASPTNFGTDGPSVLVFLVFNPVTISVVVKDADGNAIQNARVFLETAETVTDGFEFEASITSIARSGGFATATTSVDHFLNTGDKAVIRGAQPDGYNKVTTVTRLSNTTFRYNVDSGLSTPATGTPVFSRVLLQDLTTAAGVAETTLTIPADQGMKGWIRKTSASPYYVEGKLEFTSSALVGNTINVTLQEDE